MGKGSLLGRIRRAVRNSFYARKIKSVGRLVNICRPLYLRGNVVIGDRVTINRGAWIECLPLADVSNPVLIIGSGCVIGHYNEIYSTGGGNIGGECFNSRQGIYFGLQSWLFRCGCTCL